MAGYFERGGRRRCLWFDRWNQTGDTARGEQNRSAQLVRPTASLIMYGNELLCRPLRQAEATGQSGAGPASQGDLSILVSPVDSALRSWLLPAAILSGGLRWWTGGGLRWWTGGGLRWWTGGGLRWWTGTACGCHPQRRSEVVDGCRVSMPSSAEV